ncbi:hypothetical protein [Halioxenophilus sp. WMMB6]|uniref:hypothetical protein n=1 Tax=Halioxenophilus sp. WMMB6 TaxID=3073815 RepID=UPI00295F1DB7|nr:hypothetical protein [Halioxenophilus sp. WMMB6]
MNMETFHPIARCLKKNAARIKTLTIAAGMAGATAMLSGCLITSPFWVQTFDSTSALIPIQTWVTSSTQPVKFECSQAYHAGTYPPYGGETWVSLGSVMPSTMPNYDTNGLAMYGASLKRSLPASCWHQDGAYDTPTYFAAIRAYQGNSESPNYFDSFDLAGLECLGHNVGLLGSWTGWIGKGCEKTYSGSSTPVPYVKIKVEL